MPFCPRCGTPLSSHEVALGYKKVRDPSIYIKFKINPSTSPSTLSSGPKGSGLTLSKVEWVKNQKNTYLLVWTTTPWTLLANVAVAVDPKIEYIKFKFGNEFFYALSLPPFIKEQKPEIVEKVSGKSLLGLSYDPLYKFLHPEKGKIYKVVAADFISTEEGTGLVHIAPAFGEEDMNLGRKENLALIHNVDEGGKFDLKSNKWQIPNRELLKKINGRFVKDVDQIIIEDLSSRGLLLFTDPKGVEHEYPFCWRCDSPLLYYATKSWFVAMSKLRKQLIENNQKINWVPSYLKEGRFGQWLEEVRDWSFSRKRYWGTPLPIWVCEKCSKETVMGSIEDLEKNSPYNNKFYILRHGEATSNVKGVIASWPEKSSQKAKLTELGKEQVVQAAKKLKNKKIDLIFASDLYRIKETVRLIQKEIKAPVKYAKELREINCGIFNGKPVAKHKAIFSNPLEEFTKTPKEGENLSDLKMRMFNFVLNLNRNFRNKNILIISHGDPLWILEGATENLSNEEILKLSYVGLGEWREIKVKNFPYNQEGNLDLHRPFIDEIKIRCEKCRGEIIRVKDLADVWFDSGAMPFAQWHYPFKNREQIDKNLSFPADFISEGVDQTRGWFYTLLAVSTLVGKGPAYKNVISLGHVLDENGKRMSKSKGNVVDPWEVIQKYSTDALRWYFYTFNPPGEPKKFSENDIAKSLNKFSLLLLNSFAFYETYRISHQPSVISHQSKLKVLDRWVLARLFGTITLVEQNLEDYQVDRAARIIEDFINDLSRWYIRRSRRRFQKPKNKKELLEASSVLAVVFYELAKIIAPFTPFLAETIYQVLKAQGSSIKYQASVHLENWPKVKKSLIDKNLLEAMAEIRRIASLALAKRAEAGIKVRQPLKELRIKNLELRIKDNKELLDLLKDEVNVKEIIFDDKLNPPDGGEIELDTTITEELRKEGILREFIRLVQEARQDADYQPQDKIFLFIFISDRNLKKVIEANIEKIKKEVSAKEISFKKEKKYDLEKETKIDNQPIWLGLRKVKI